MEIQTTISQSLVSSTVSEESKLANAPVISTTVSVVDDKTISIISVEIRPIPNS